MLGKVNNNIQLQDISEHRHSKRILDGTNILNNQSTQKQSKDISQMKSISYEEEEVKNNAPDLESKLHSIAPKETSVQKSLLHCIDNDEYFSKEDLEYYKIKYEGLQAYQTSTVGYKNSYLKKQFKKGDMIGEGGFGKVYKGFDEVDGKPFALKEIKIAGSSSKSVRKCILCVLETAQH